jgi:hypothetical protein
MSGRRRPGTEEGTGDVDGGAWCEICRRELVADEVGDEGTCPDCGEPLSERRRIPWTFKLMIVATVIYLGYRLYQGIVLVIHHI